MQLMQISEPFSQLEFASLKTHCVNIFNAQGRAHSEMIY